MNKKGFTLIELLAVIVILAIIALIATPIVLNIIKDARDSSDERSVELYGDAVEQAIMRAQTKGIPVESIYISSNDGKTLKPFETTDDSKDLTVDYSGSKVECSIVKVNANGEIYLSQCSVNGIKTNKKYGKYQQVFKPQYYSTKLYVINEVVQSELSTVMETDLISAAYDVKDEKIRANYACFIRNDKEYCIKFSDADAYKINQAIIADAFEELVDTSACSFSEKVSYCYDTVYENLIFTVSFNSYGHINLQTKRDNFCIIDEGDTTNRTCYTLSQS